MFMINALLRYNFALNVCALFDRQRKSLGNLCAMSIQNAELPGYYVRLMLCLSRKTVALLYFRLLRCAILVTI